MSARTVTYLLFVWALRVQSAYPTDSTTEIIERHRASVELIHSWSCGYKVLDHGKAGQVFQTGEVWSSPSGFRMRTRFQPGANMYGLDYRIDDEWQLADRHVSVMEESVTGKITKSASVHPPSSVPDDMRGRIHLTFRCRDARYVGLDELFKTKTQLILYKPHDSGANNLAVLDMIRDGIRYELSFDPRANFLVKNLVQEYWPKPDGAPSRERVESSVSRFEEVAPAVYFPVVLRLAVAANGKRVLDHEYQLTNVRVNHPIPDSGFRPQYPAGTEIVNAVTQTIDRATDNGGTTPTPGKIISPHRPVTSPVGSAVTRQTTDETDPIVNAIRWTSFILILIGMSLWAYRAAVRPRAEMPHTYESRP